MKISDRVDRIIEDLVATVNDEWYMAVERNDTDMDPEQFINTIVAKFTASADELKEELLDEYYAEEE